MKEISKALLEAQKKIKNADKDAANAFLKKEGTGKAHRYASLESVLDAVKDPANESDLAIVQSCGKDEAGHFVETKLFHISGESINSRVYLVLDRQNMQGLGSAITYGRRYSLAAMFAIGQEDDDGNEASKAPAKQGPAPAKPNAVKTKDASPLPPAKPIPAKAPEKTVDPRKEFHEPLNVERERLGWSKDKLGKFIQDNFSKAGNLLDAGELKILLETLKGTPA
jgi:hypothetical protein